MTKNSNMMKKIFFLVAFLVLGKIGYSQYPLTQFIGTDSANVISKGGLQGRLINTVYSDTTQANTQRIRQYPGAQIVTNGAGMKIWLRNSDATRWLQIPAGSGVGNIYTIDGTLTGNRELDGDGYALNFETVRRFSVGGDTVFFNVPYQEYRTGTQQFMLSDTLAKLVRTGKATLLVESTNGGSRLVLAPTGPPDESKYEINALNEEFWIAQLKDDESAADTLFFISNAGNVGIGTTSPTAKLEVIDSLGVAANFQQRTSSNTDVALNIRATGNRGFAAIIEQRDSSAAGTQYQTIFRKAMMPGTGNPANGGAVGWYTQVGNDNSQYMTTSVYRSRLVDTTGYAAGSGAKSTATEFWTRKNNAWDTTLVLTAGGVRMPSLPQASGTKSLRIDASGNLSYADTLTNGVSGSGIANYMTRWTGSGTIDTSQIYQNDGRVGIGTTTPAQKLDVNGDALINGVRIGNGVGDYPSNVIVGTGSLDVNTTGAGNSAFGFGSLQSNTSGGSNSAYGSTSLQLNTTGYNNSAFGVSALQKNTTGYENVGVGSNSLLNNTTGADNIAIGRESGRYISSGSDNTISNTSIYIGANTRPSANNESNQIVIGHNVTGNGSNSVTLGNTSITKTILRANVGVGTTTPDSALTVVNGAYFQRGVRMSGLPTGVGTKALRINANGTLSIADTLANGISGSGTTDYVSKFTSANSLGNSKITDGTFNEVGFEGTGVAGGSLNFKNYSSVSVKGAGYSSIYAFGTKFGFSYIPSAEKTFYLELNGLTNNIPRTYTVPDKNGTLALTSDITDAVSGTTNYIPKFTSSSAIGNSAMYESGGSFVIPTSNVLVGTTSAGKNISIYSSSNGNNGFLRMYDLGNTERLQIGVNSTGEAVYYSPTGSVHAWYINSEQMRLTSTGLGIGTSSPAAKLESVQGTSGAGGWFMAGQFTAANYPMIRLAATTPNKYSSIGNNADGGFAFLVNGTSGAVGTQAMTLDASGNLGLATTSVNTTVWGASFPKLAIGTTTSAGVLLFQSTATAANNKYLGGISALNLGSGVTGNESANIVFYQDGTSATNPGSKILFQTRADGGSFATRATLDNAGNLGLGVTPAAWGGQKALDMEYGGFSSGTAVGSIITANAYYNGTNYIYKFNFAASNYLQAGGAHQWLTAPSGTAGNTITFTQAMTLNANGELLIGTTTDAGNYKLQVNGNTYHNGIFNLVDYGGATTNRWELYQFTDNSFRLNYNGSGADELTLTSSGNLGLGVTPSAWAGTGVKAFQFQNGSLAASSSFGTLLSYNSIFDGSYKYLANGTAGQYLVAGNEHIWYQAASGTAGNAISFTQAMTLDASGNLQLGTTTNKTTVIGASGSGQTIGGSGTVNLSVWNTGNADWVYSLAVGNDGTVYNYNKGNTPMTFWTNASERMRITSGGNVGIGTTSPSNFTNYTTLSISGTNGGVLDLMYQGTSQMRLSAENGNNYISGVTSAPIIFGTNNSERMRITSGGSVNITADGTNTTFTSSGQLAIKRANGAPFMSFHDDNGSRIGYFQVQASGVASLGNDVAQPLAFITNGSERMRITSGGILAVGTTSPYADAIAHFYQSSNASRYVYAENPNTGTSASVFFNAAAGAGGDLRLGAYGTNHSTQANNATVFNHKLTGSLLFGTEGTERMRITSGGNVGIGTTSPTSITNYTALTINGTSGSFTEYQQGGSYAFRVGSDNSEGGFISQTTANPIRIFTNSSERMRITSGGNVGIGTTSPTQKLHVFGTSGATTAIIEGATNASAYGKLELRGRPAGAGQSTGWIVAASTEGGQAATNVAGIDFTMNGASGNAHNMLFSTHNGTSLAEKMRITSGGNVGIGTTSPTYPLEVRGNILVGDNTTNTMRFGSYASESFIYSSSAIPLTFYTNASERMRITSVGEVYIAGTTDQGAYNLQVNGTGVWGAGAYVDGSDIKLKDNVKDLGSALGLIMNIKPKTFTYKPFYNESKATQVGFIAQELEEVLKDEVYKDGVIIQGKEYKGVAYQSLIPLLVKALQEQQAQIEELKKKLQ